MTTRSIRRAAEREARKAAAKQNRLAQQNLPAEAQPAEGSAVVSEAQLAANRANAQFSTGPRTAEGKSISSLNAVRTGLTGRTVLLASDDAEAYRLHVARYEAEYKPVGLRESELVQSLADGQWRYARIPHLEIAIYARGQQQFGDQFEELEPDVRRARIELQTFLHYEKPLRNLHIQEARLRRQREKDTAELRDLQAKRRKREEGEAAAAAAVTASQRNSNPAKATCVSPDPLLEESQLGSFLQIADWSPERSLRTGTEEFAAA